MAREAPYAQLFWPTGGISYAEGYLTQPQNTCVDALNVRSVDPTTNRNRGAQRMGLSKYLGGTLNSTNFIQNLEHITISGSVATSTGASVRGLVGVGVAGGTVKTFVRGGVYGAVTGGTGALNSTSPFIGSAILFSQIFYSDGVHWVCYDAPSNSMITMVPTYGALPTDSSGNAPRLIVTWRGRLVWSGLQGDPQNWFMSRQFAPLDYDYNPNVVTRANSQQAVAGNNCEAGLVPDIVNALIPYSDDILIFLCDHSIWQMTGDPAAGGQIDRISDIVGGCFGTPWTKDSFGNVYFFGSRGGIYMMHPVPGATAAPQRITETNIDSALLNVDLSKNIIRMEWDDRFQHVMIFVTPINGASTFNYAYDTRSNAFWKDQFSNVSHNATAVHQMDGDNPNDRVVLLGGQDGVIRFLDLNAEDDDGIAIDSFVILGPIQANSGRIRLKELRPVLGRNSDPVTLEVFVGNSAEEAFNVDEAMLQATLYPGRGPAIRSGAVGQCLYLKLSNSSIKESWQYESIFAAFEGTGRAAGRMV